MIFNLENQTSFDVTLMLMDHRIQHNSIIIKFIYGLSITRIVGLVDQLEDRLLCKQEAARSNRAQSTIFLRFVLTLAQSLHRV